jgi:hypothetical protein
VDGIVTLCELKYTREEFTVTKAYARELKRKIDVFETRTRTRKDVQIALVSLWGHRPNTWSEGLISQSVTAEQVFGIR